MSRKDLFIFAASMLAAGFYIGARVPDTLAWGGFATVAMIASIAGNARVMWTSRRTDD